MKEDIDSAVSIFNKIESSSKMLPERITIYDSTLRDGEQMPGLSFSREQKLQVARKLDELGVPEIEAGFPAVSQSEMKNVKKIVQEKLDATILVLSRLKRADIDAAVACDADVVLLFIASSPLHRKYKLGLSKDEIKEKVVDAVQYAKDHGVTPSFSTEDSTRTPLDFLQELVQVAQDAGAERIGFTDTVGCASPEGIAYLFSRMKDRVQVPMSAHLHNDFGLALANALTALQNGATHVCATVNGWGERAGNVPLEQLVMSLKYLYDHDTGIATERLYSLSDMVARFAKLPKGVHQPWVGENAFTHESGIHVAAVLNNSFTYESVHPEKIGNKRRVVLGKHSGHTVIDCKLEEMNISPSVEERMQIVSAVKSLGEKKGVVDDQEFMRIVHETIGK